MIPSGRMFRNTRRAIDSAKSLYAAVQLSLRLQRFDKSIMLVPHSTQGKKWKARLLWTLRWLTLLKRSQRDSFRDQNLRSWLENSLGDENETTQEPCVALCCIKDDVYYDAHIDRKQTEEYIERLLPEKGAEDTI